MSIILRRFSLDEATLSGGAGISSAGGGLPRRISLEAGGGAARLLASYDAQLNFFMRAGTPAAGIVQDYKGHTVSEWLGNHNAINLGTAQCHPLWQAGSYKYAGVGFGYSLSAADTPIVGRRTDLPWTMGGWARANNGATGNIFASLLDGVGASAGAGAAFGLAYYSGIVRHTFQLGGSTSGRAVAQFGAFYDYGSPARWYNWVVRSDGTGHTDGMDCFINGVKLSKVFTANNLVGTSVSTHPLFFGITPSGYTVTTYYGELAEIWGVPSLLTDDEIYDLCLGASARARWTMNFSAAATIKTLGVPGRLGSDITRSVGKVYWRKNGGARTLVSPSDPIDESVVDGDTVDFDVDLPMALGDGARLNNIFTPEISHIIPFVGGLAGDGPVLAYDATGAAPPTYQATIAPVGQAAVITPVVTKVGIVTP